MALKYHIKTYGCQMNYSDSERAASVLENIGFKPTHAEKNADFILFNTCSVRQKAEDRILGLFPHLENLKKNNKNLIVALTGCMAHSGDFLKHGKAVDIVFPIDEIAKLPLLIKKIRPSLIARHSHEINSDTLENYFHITPKYSSKFQSFVPIMTGCDKFCSYCIVPYTRGREKSRKMREVFDECEKLVSSGCVEITLLGQNVNSYGLSSNGKKSQFAKLLHVLDVLKTKGLKRVRWTSPHPRDMTMDVIEAAAKLKTQMPYIHLPIQAGNDEVLRRMNRPYTVSHYKKIIRKIRDAIPDCAISTDIIVGFCGETEQQFEDTCRLFEEIKWDMAYIAKYSPRKGTLAWQKMKNDVSCKEKTRRWHKLNNILKKISYEKNKAFVGKTAHVLVEKCENGICEGRCEHFKKTQFKGKKSLVGKIVPVKITEAREWDLGGVLK